MSDNGTRKDSSGRIHLVAIIAVTVLVMVLGVLVVAFPGPMGVPQEPATPASTPTATITP
jgi:hypothetical protein